jgi:hypothetical protein
MSTFLAISSWLHATALGAAMGGGVSWLWPLCETLHFIGMAMLFGCIGALDFRLLGLAKELPIEPLNRLVPFGILGFAINLLTGFLFYIGEPGQYATNGAFWLKMLFILLAGLNVGAFYVLGIHRRVAPLGPGEDAPPSAKVIGATSLVLWAGVMYWGRMLPFIGNSF